MAEATLPAFEFRRRGDDVVYRFDPEPGHEPPRWKRADLDLWCEFLPDRGWRIIDSAGTATGWPEREERETKEPPSGPWNSAKDGKSYVYDLVYLD